ncbi:hypothetical protein RhiXN_05537 [Rhizoctonia solani]|uniref:Uncharacterized protein n=1 Tax=Rhizoctonia solani TaxID=456999 RepID=A0A8H8SXQ2_9AGAM|nr:uncharacterized protein RhiXN_05537 [Rhizoctonia solani]QRW20548.1 hypothetical protein RhiXN_05537 [Rhizoctonia solani]
MSHVSNRPYGTRLVLPAGTPSSSSRGEVDHSVLPPSVLAPSGHMIPERRALVKLLLHEEVPLGALSASVPRHDPLLAALLLDF